MNDYGGLSTFSFIHRLAYWFGSWHVYRGDWGVGSSVHDVWSRLVSYGCDVASVSRLAAVTVRAAGRCKRGCTLRAEAAATPTPRTARPHNPPAHAILTNR